MTQATLVEIAEGVTEQLAAAYGAAKLSANVSVERRYDSRFKLSDLDDFDETQLATADLCQVVVTPLSEDSAPDKALRSKLMIKPRVSIILAAKPALDAVTGQVSVAAVDALLFLLEELRDFFFRNDATLRAVEIDTIAHPDFEEILMKRMFVGSFVLAFTDLRSRRGT